MIVPDTSVWIANIRNQSSVAAVMKLRDPAIQAQFLIGDIIITEVLQGARTELDSGRLETNLRQFPVAPMVGDALAVKAARHYRVMRSFGFTMRIADLLIGTFCIEHSHALLHCDSDFTAMEKFCGLRVL